MDIESARANPIPLDPYRFSVAVKDAEDKPVYFSGNNGGVRILDDKGPLIYQKKPITIHLAACLLYTSTASGGKVQGEHRGVRRVLVVQRGGKAAAGHALAVAGSGHAGAHALSLIHI